MAELDNWNYGVGLDQIFIELLARSHQVTLKRKICLSNQGPDMRNHGKTNQTLIGGIVTYETFNIA